MQLAQAQMLLQYIVNCSSREQVTKPKYAAFHHRITFNVNFMKDQE